MLKTKLALSLPSAFVAAALVAMPASAKSSSSSPSSSSGHAGPAATKTREPLPAGTHFVRKTCKTASCKAKHPGGNYMLPIKPKKDGGTPA